MHLHLLSTPGDDPISDVVDAVGPYLKSLHDPTVAYLPAASEEPQAQYLGLTERAFSRLAQVELVDLASGRLADALNVLSRCSLIYIPGGNTYLLANRLRSSTFAQHLESRLRQGLPLVAFSAGTVIVGHSIAMSSDENTVGLTHSSGLAMVSFTFAVHYPVADPESVRSFRERLRVYQGAPNPPVLALEDGAYLRVEGLALSPIRGRCHLFDAGREDVIVRPGTMLAAA